MHDTEIISALRLVLADRIGHDRFDLWFGRSCRLQLQDDALTVHLADQFSLEWVRNHFRDELEAVLCELRNQGQLTGEPGIKFRIDSSLKVAPADLPVQDFLPSADENRSKPTTPFLPRRKFSRLEDFVVGTTSQVAYTSCQMVATQPGAVSPLFLHGPHGVGKTHLLEGVWSSLRRSDRTRRLVYLSSEQFTGFFLEALHGSGLPSFRRKYRGNELLILDDVQFFAGKKATLVELLHTIDTLLRDGRQLIFAADRPPSELTALGTDILGRMTGGLVCQMELPERPTRYEITRQMASVCEIAIPKVVLSYIASHFPGDARQLQGAVNRLKATSQGLQKPVTIELAEEVLSETIRSTCRSVHLEQIERAVCDVLGIDDKSLRSRRKCKSVSHPRMLAMWLARKYTRAALSEIAYHFGQRSHSTVVSAQKRVQRWLSNGEHVQLADRTWKMEVAVEHIENRLRTG